MKINDLRTGASGWRALPLVGLALAFSACGSGDVQAARDGAERLKPVYDGKTGRLQELLYDSNGDGKSDMRAFMNGPNLVKAEVDENGDGRPDRWEYYAQPSGHPPGGSAGTAAAPRTRPVLDHVEESSNHDGRITRREFYQGGRLARAEEDTNGDGRADRWDTYDRGVLATMELDLNHDGQPDRRLVYSADDNTVRSETLQDTDVPHQKSRSSPKAP